MLGFVWIVINSAYAIGFWYGWTLTQDSNENYSVGKILLVFFSIIIAVFSLGNAAPFITTLSSARAAAFEVFKIIDRVRMNIKKYGKYFNNSY
jgi:ATP-binding cassette subfamily B (MDR/TAP) protein 1